MLQSLLQLHNGISGRFSCCNVFLALHRINAQQLYYEDQHPLLYLKGGFGGTVKPSEIKEANEVYGYLKDKAQVKAIISEDEEYMNDAVIIPAYLAKGQQFDVVLVYNARNENYCCEEERLLFYSACTRALHMLCVYYSGKCTPLLQREHCCS